MTCWRLASMQQQMSEPSPRGDAVPGFVAARVDTPMAGF